MERIMKINEDLIKRVANNETPLEGESVRIAKRILDEGAMPAFKKHAFVCKGAKESWEDFQDCILDFSSEGALIRVFDVSKEVDKYFNYLEIYGMTIQQTLKKLFDIHRDHNLEGKIFKVRYLSGRYKISDVALHYCFGKGRISEEVCLDMMRISN